MARLRIGSRGSQLALWQAGHIKKLRACGTRLSLRLRSMTFLRLDASIYD